MPSGTSPELGLELIETGTQATIWGNTTNTNLELIESAIAGRAVISLTGLAAGGTYTLTNIPWTPDEARNMIIELQGTPLGACAIIIPAVSKVYVVANNTVGGFSVAVTTAIVGSVTTTVPAGYVKIVACDGVGVYETNTAVSQILLGADPTIPLQAATKQYVDNAVSGIPASFPSGTSLAFWQSSAPPGWTQNVAFNDYAMRITNGSGGVTGGTIPFSAAFTSYSAAVTGGTALTIAQMPSHTHTLTDPGHAHTFYNSVVSTRSNSGAVAPGISLYFDSRGTKPATTGITIASTGGSGTHNHTLNFDMSVQYVDFILCVKN